MIDRKKLKVELARRGLAQWQLANQLGIVPSTLSDYVRGARPAPPHLVSQIASALGVPPLALDTGPEGTTR